MRIVDRVAYINHDIDDAIRSAFSREDDLPRKEIELLGPTGAERIDLLVRDLVDMSAEAGDIVQSPEVGGAMLSLRTFMFERVYLGPQVEGEARGHEAVRRSSTTWSSAVTISTGGRLPRRHDGPLCADLRGSALSLARSLSPRWIRNVAPTER